MNKKVKIILCWSLVIAVFVISYLLLAPKTLNVYIDKTLFPNGYHYEIADSSIATVSEIDSEDSEFINLEITPISTGDTALIVYAGEEANLATDWVHGLSVKGNSWVCDVTTGNSTRCNVWILATFLFLLMFQHVMLQSFLERKDHNLYSYEIVYDLGLNFLLVGVLLQQAFLIIKAMLFPELFVVYELYESIIRTSVYSMIFSVPFVVIFSAALTISNISLIRHEGFSFVNSLGIILSFMMVIGLLFGWQLVDGYIISKNHLTSYLVAVSLYSTTFVYQVSLLLGMMICGAIAARREPNQNTDYVIILGCAIRKDGSPKPLLKGRVDRALAFIDRQKETSGKSAVLVPSGGQGSDEVISEAESMERYIRSRGYTDTSILKEANSTNTLENMKYSKKIIDESKSDAETPQIAFATTNYHVFRSGVLAKKAGLNAVGMGSKTKWYFWPNAAVREMIGLVVSEKYRVLAFLVASDLFFISLALILQYADINL